MSGTINLLGEDAEIRNDTMFLYIYVDDLMASRNKIIECGGKVIQEVFTMEGYPGQLLIFYDPFGNKFGLWSDN